MEQEFKKIDSHFKKMLESKKFLKLLYGLGVLIIAGVIFHAGIEVGARKASFGNAYGQHYFENFGMERHGPLGELSEHFSNPNGAVGKIIQITSPTFVVEGSDNTEKVILITDDTEFLLGRQKVSESELKIDGYVVVVGIPDEQGQVEARLVRIMPAPPLMPMMNGQTQTSGTATSPVQ